MWSAFFCALKTTEDIKFFLQILTILVLSVLLMNLNLNEINIVLRIMLVGRINAAMYFNDFYAAVRVSYIQWLPENNGIGRGY